MFDLLKKTAVRTLLRPRLLYPPSLILFVTSQCNAVCRHCFNWMNLNRKDELTIDEIENLSLSLGKINDIAISGGEPFLREDLPDICALFFQNNGLTALGIPTNGLLPKRIFEMTKKILKLSGGKKVIIRLSLDGMREKHDEIRGIKGSFESVFKTYRLLHNLKLEFCNLELHVNPVLTNQNYLDLFELTNYIKMNMPDIDSYGFAFVRGDVRDKSYSLPSMDKIRKLCDYVDIAISNDYSIKDRACRKAILHYRIETISQSKQVIPCQAGRLIGVVMDNGDVRSCELLPPIGNLRRRTFFEIWNSKEMKEQRNKIRQGNCFCTHECFLFPSMMGDLSVYPRLFFYLIKSLKGKMR